VEKRPLSPASGYESVGCRSVCCTRNRIVRFHGVKEDEGGGENMRRKRGMNVRFVPCFGLTGTEFRLPHLACISVLSFLSRGTPPGDKWACQVTPTTFRNHSSAFIPADSLSSNFMRRSKF